MRAGGCVINDILDQKQDKMVVLLFTTLVLDYGDEFHQFFF